MFVGHPGTMTPMHADLPGGYMVLAGTSPAVSKCWTFYPPAAGEEEIDNLPFFPVSSELPEADAELFGRYVL